MAASSAVGSMPAGKASGAHSVAWGISRLFPQKDTATVLLLPDGTIRLFPDRITVAEVLREFPDCHVDSHSALRCQLAPEKVLRPGSTYYLGKKSTCQGPLERDSSDVKGRKTTKHRRTHSVAPARVGPITRRPCLSVVVPSPRTFFPDFPSKEGTCTGFNGPTSPTPGLLQPALSPYLSGRFPRVDATAAQASPVDHHRGEGQKDKSASKPAHRRAASVQALEIPDDVTCQEEERGEGDQIELPLSPGFFTREEESTPGSGTRFRNRQTRASVKMRQAPGRAPASPQFEAAVTSPTQPQKEGQSILALQSLLQAHTSSGMLNFSPTNQREVRVSVARASSIKENTQRSWPVRTISSCSETSRGEGPRGPAGIDLSQRSSVLLPVSLSVDEYSVYSPTSSASFSPGAMGSSESSCGTPGSFYWDSPRGVESPRTSMGPYCLTPFFKEPKPASRFKGIKHDS